MKSKTLCRLGVDPALLHPRNFCFLRRLLLPPPPRPTHTNRGKRACSGVTARDTSSGSFCWPSRPAARDAWLSIRRWRFLTSWAPRVSTRWIAECRCQRSGNSTRTAREPLGAPRANELLQAVRKRRDRGDEMLAAWNSLCSGFTQPITRIRRASSYRFYSGINGNRLNWH